MGILDKKTTIIDFQLTDKGRELLSENRLNFTYYVFSDDQIDYSGSLSDRQSAQTTSTGSSFDDFVHTNTFSFEPIRRNDKSINNFLYTMPLGDEVVPQFNSSITGSFTLNRNYSIDKIENIVKSPKDIEKIIAQDNVLDYVVVVEDVNETPSPVQRNKDYVSEQLKTALEKIKK